MNKSSELPNLDLLRAVAVLMVLFDHTFQAIAFKSVRVTWLGRLGVLFFFVHTCCVLMMSLERQAQAGQRSTWVFYIRRFFRIYPLSMAAVAVAWVFQRHTLSLFGWLSNLALIQNLTMTPDAFPGIWSLPIEVQMYVFLPLLFLLASRSRTIFPLVVVWIGSIIAAFAHANFSHQLSLLTFAPCFIPGVIAWMLFSKRRLQLPAWTWPFFLLGLVAAFEVRPNWDISAWTACLALGLSMPLFAQSTSKPLNQITFLLAKYSYGIYLGHSILLLLIVPTFRTLPVYLAAVILAAVFGFSCIEHPMMRLGRKLTAQKISAGQLQDDSMSDGDRHNPTVPSSPTRSTAPSGHLRLAAGVASITED